jgi:ribonuclease P protein component
MDNRLRKQEILRRKKDFERVLFRGKRRQKGALRLYYAPAPVETGMRRAAFITGGKFPSNVARNRMRRRLRELYRTNKERFPLNSDFILRADVQALDLAPLVFNQTALSLLTDLDENPQITPSAQIRAGKKSPESVDRIKRSS